ncbi:uncharacterized protein LOC103314435 [Tribolium castaneum]|uniref:Uncharacterized protein n=1 Tax=Tribolium castaneum TaxID=7070 RepID=D6X4E1_TRICA|nr:PREDICTED: uncharacterized protein LOC103314435 [Tribolium castaneum]EEZ97280.1 hypothetical protein TcasGA2_TC011084 [Tribolium castaneum]|eukprot:XP_008198737.1 PREDICTED: uncharacterized protein LOC103314435 [Tribolium castaneum]
MERWKLLILILYHVLPTNGQIMDMMKPKTVRVHKLETCPGHEKAPLIIKNVQLSYANRVNLISLQTVVRETVPEDIKLKLVLKRCKSREALDSCEKYQNINMNHLCGMLNGLLFSKLPNLLLPVPLKRAFTILEMVLLMGPPLGICPFLGGTGS